ncbi:MAG: N-acetyltransferase [Desulfobacteraceae bacterium]|nr:MAG: N-acetyltransferase [Desulfobacteraceae bacterium]
MLHLEPFDETDAFQLIREIPDDRFLLQWAGPKYRFPLDMAQIMDTLAKTCGKDPSHKVFKAVLKGHSETIGHIQLMDIDYGHKNCVLGRVLIFSGYRGRGFGSQMIECAVRYAFDGLGMSEITLGVFDFNQSAIATYRKVGFKVFQVNRGARPFRDEIWNVLKMRITRNAWMSRYSLV